MPKTIQNFAQQSLIRPVLVNVGRAGATNLDIIQEVEYVKQEAKMVYLLECLQKTPPPVIVFSDNKNEVDDIQEYLLLKGLQAVAIHGSKTQEEREYAIKAFKTGAKDVMVASGVASKGLDFNEIQHVINYTMPKEIEDYVHQIGRTGRSGKTGIATTFVNMNTQEQTLLDLKYLLMEAKQRTPPFLAALEDPNQGQGGSGCPVCGGPSSVPAASSSSHTSLTADRSSSSFLVPTRLSLRSRARRVQLPQARGRPATQGGREQPRHRRRLLRSTSRDRVLVRHWAPGFGSLGRRVGSRSGGSFMSFTHLSQAREPRWGKQGAFIRKRHEK